MKRVYKRMKSRTYNFECHVLSRPNRSLVYAHVFFGSSGIVIHRQSQLVRKPANGGKP